MKHRKKFIVALALGILAAPVPANAQQSKIFRIGYLGNAPFTDPETSRIVGALLQGLRELGYNEGHNLVIEWRFIEGRLDRYPDYAAELVRLKVDVIVAIGTLGPVAAQRATTTIPIVMANAADPVASGLVASLARPGGNTTGLSLMAVDLTAKQLELLKEAVPPASRVAFLWNPGNLVHRPTVDQARQAARVLGVDFQLVEARTSRELDTAFAAMTRKRASALLVPADPVFYLYRTRLAELAARARVPAMYGVTEHPKAGGLMAYAPDLANMFRRAATYVDKILKGAKPADLPVEQPTRFELVINMKTAKALGLTIPQTVLIRATEVIQ